MSIDLANEDAGLALSNQQLTACLFLVAKYVSDLHEAHTDVGRELDHSNSKQIPNQPSHQAAQQPSPNASQFFDPLIENSVMS
jgi:hypothetical protein